MASTACVALAFIECSELMEIMPFFISCVVYLVSQWCNDPAIAAFDSIARPVVPNPVRLSPLPPK